MFYSHEILTQRKHGIATIWLVATLGSKSSSKRITKRAILEVNIQKACEVVQQPQVPMALRLESNLLIGISRVYLSQCGYVLTDAESIQHAMRSLLKVMRDAQLDPNAGKARPDQLFLTDDPGFVPDMLPELDMDFSVWGTSTPTASQSSRNSGPSPVTSQGSRDDGFNIIIPSDASPSVVERAGSGNEQEKRRSLGLDDDPDILVDAGFDFDADGNLIDAKLEEAVRQSRDEAGGTAADPGAFEPGSLGAAHQDEAARGAQLNQFQDEVDIIPLNVDEMQLDLVLPRSIQEDSDQRRHEDNQDQAQHTLHDQPLQDIDEEPENGMAAAGPVAPIRHERKARPLQVDQRQDMSSSVLQSWQTDYLANMKNAKKQKGAKRLPMQAKKFAAACVWGNGLGGLGREGSLMLKHSPLNMFAGQNLKDMIFGTDYPTKSKPKGKKRSRSEEPAREEYEERNVRRKSDEIEVGRGAEDHAAPLFEDDIEFGRAAGEMLDDHPSQMPWNIFSSQNGSQQGSQGGSRTGSMRPRSRAGSIPIVPFSAGGPPSSATTDLQELRNRVTKQLSESPLQSRSRRHPSSDDPEAITDAFDFTNGEAMEDFELYGPAALVDTQTANDSQWIEGELRQQEGNFMLYFQKHMRETNQSEFTFEDLIPFNKGYAAAAQGFLHVLSLASKNVLEVSQHEGVFDAPIQLKLAAGV